MYQRTTSQKHITPSESDLEDKPATSMENTASDYSSTNSKTNKIQKSYLPTLQT
jgi:hypothetical protein